MAASTAKPSASSWFSEMEFSVGAAPKAASTIPFSCNACNFSSVPQYPNSLSRKPTSRFLKRLVVQLSPRGELLEDRAPAGEAIDPRIGRDPILFLRARTLGFAAAIEGILADLRTREDLPWSLLNIVGEESPVPDAREANSSGDANGEAEADADVL